MLLWVQLLILQFTGQSPKQAVIQPKMPIVPKLGSLELDNVEMTHKPYGAQDLNTMSIFLVIIVYPFTQDLRLMFVIY